MSKSPRSGAGRRSIWPRLPRSVQPGLLATFDWTLLTCMLTVGLVLCGAVLWLHLIYHPAPPLPLPDDGPWLEVPRSLPPPSTTISVRPQQAGEQAVQPEKGRSSQRPSGPAIRRSVKRGDLERQVSRMGLLAVLGHRGRGRSAAANLLGNGRPDTRLARAFTGLGGTRVATRGTLPGLHDDVDSDPGQISGGGELQLTGPGAQQTGRMVVERTPRAVVRPEPRLHGCPWPSPNIMPVVRRGLPAIRACYERQLRRSPRLGGKIALRFRIDPLGRVGQVAIDQDTVDHPLVSSCILRSAARWRFPPIPEGAADVVVPFLLQPGN